MLNLGPMSWSAMSSRKKGLFLGALSLVTAAAGATAWTVGRSSPPAVQNVVFQLQWTHSATQAGFYSADRNGDYAKHGLQVEFLIGGPTVNMIDSVVTGKAQIGLANAAELIRARSNGAPVKAVACIYRRSPLVYITLESSGITHPRQFANKTIRASHQNTIILRAIISRYDVDFGTIKIVSTNDLNKFISGEIDVWSGYRSVSLESMNRLGLKVNWMHPENFGVDFYETCVFTTDQVIGETPDVVSNFLTASLRYGWPRVFQNPEEAAMLVASYGPDLSLEAEARTIGFMLPLVDTGTGDIGWMERSAWDFMVEEIREKGLIEVPVNPKDVFDMRFLERIFDKKKTVP